MSAKDEEYVSTTMLAKSIQLKPSDLAELLNDNGWTRKEGKHRMLTDKGINAGGKYKNNDKGEKWAVWPLSIIETMPFKSDILGTMTQVKRKFKLPGEDDLNKDQDKVYELPENGQFLIVGGPGTGKSVVALLRAMKFHKNNDYAFLTYNKILLSATKQLVDFKLNSFTLDSWLGKAYWAIFEKFVPKVDDDKNLKDNSDDDSYSKPDYNKLIESLEAKDLSLKSDHIIIDEGQDKPPKFYESLMHFGIENFFIVADQNQQITEDNSSRQQLTDILGLEVEEVIELKENFRNSHPVALFSNTFFTDPSSPAPSLPPKTKSSLGTPILFEHKDDNDVINLILNEADRDNRNLIGVVVSNDAIRDKYAQALEKLEIKSDHPKPIISTYSSKDRRQPNINFAYSGIVVLNDKSIKGLEFDIVFIIVDGFTIYNNDVDSMKKRFYVMSSRAIKKLVLLKHSSYNGGIDNILPKEEYILKREVL